MFTINVRNVDELYTLLQAKKHGWIAQLDVIKEPVADMYTRIEPRGNGYSLDTIIGKVNLARETEPLHPERIISRLPDYEILVAGEAQIVLKKDNREYILERKKLNSLLRVQQGVVSKEEFKKQLLEYAKVLQVFVESFYAQSDIPNNLYVLGSLMPTEYKVSPAQTPFSSNPDQREVDLAELERKIEIVNPNVSFEEIGGSRQAKVEIQRIYSDIIHPEIARFCGRDPDKKKGYLLVGESGAGKTLLVKALATKLKAELADRVKFYAVDYSNITSIYRGGEARATALLFDLVKRNEEQQLSTLLFLDEIHTIGQRKKEYNEALDTLLAQLDGMTTYKGLTTIGATYLPVDSLDSALLRPGRLSVQISIAQPTNDERQEIFSIYIRQRQQMAAAVGNKHLFTDLDLPRLAQEAQGFNGSHIAGVVEKVISAKEDEMKQKIDDKASVEQLAHIFTPITMEDFLQAIKRYEKVERASPKIGFGLNDK